MQTEHFVLIIFLPLGHDPDGAKYLHGVQRPVTSLLTLYHLKVCTLLPKFFSQSSPAKHSKKNKFHHQLYPWFSKLGFKQRKGVRILILKRGKGVEQNSYCHINSSVLCLNYGKTKLFHTFNVKR